MFKNLFALARMIENEKETRVEAHTRRQWLKQAAAVSATGIVLVACGRDEKKSGGGGSSSPDPMKTDNKMATDGKNDPKSQTNNNANAQDAGAGTVKLDLVADGGLLNAALALEHEAIAIYTAAAGLDYMKADAVAPILAIAGTFLAHHKGHAAALTSAINGMREKNSKVAAPVAAKSSDDYVKPHLDFLGDSANGVRNVLRLASEREMNAAKAYLGLISSFTDPQLAQTSGMLGGEEASHYGALRAALFAVIQDSDVTAETVIPAALPSGFAQKLK